jgi:DNA-binding MarR family transcriptional regulator
MQVLAQLGARVCSKIARVMSITATQIVQALVYADRHIEVLRGPTLDYKEYISVCRADGLAVSGILSREILKELVAAGFVKEEGPENDRMVTIFRLTDEGRAEAALKQKKGAGVRSTGEMNHFHLHLCNDPVAGAAGRAIINAKLKARLFWLGVRQYQGFSAPGTGRSQLVRFLRAVSHGYPPALFHLG